MLQSTKKFVVFDFSHLTPQILSSPENHFIEDLPEDQYSFNNLDAFVSMYIKSKELGTLVSKEDIAL